MAIKIPPLKAKATQYPTIRVISPGRGLNNLVSAELIDDKEASDLNNVVFSEAGTVIKGPGVKAWGSALSNNPRGLGSLSTQTGVRQVVTVDGGIVKHTSNAGDTWTAASGATMTANVPVTFTSLRTNPNASSGADVLYLWDGTLSGCYFDGSTVTRPGTMPAASYSIFFNGFHIAAGTKTNTSRLYIADTNAGQASGVSLAYVQGTESWATFVSAGFNATLTATTPPSPNNPVDVPGATVAGGSGTAPNIIDVNPGDGDSITGLAKFQGSIIIFKHRSIYQLSFDQSTGLPTVTLINTYLGAVSHRSIDNVENDVFYLTTLGWFTLGYQEGYYTLIRTNELSVRIHPLIATINQSNLGQVAAIYQPYQFLSSIPSGGSSFNNITVVYDKRYDAWSKLDYVHAESFTVYTDTNLVQHLLYTDSNAGMVWEIDSTISTSNGSAIDAYWQSKAYDGGQPELTKFWIDVTLYFRQVNGTITVTIFTDNGTVLHTSTIGGQQFNGGIAATGYIGSERYGGNTNVARTLTTIVTNLITNPSFESGTTGWTALQGIETLSQSTTQALEGTHSLKCITTGASSQGPVYTVTGLVSGNQYNYGGWVFMPNGVTYTVEIDQFTTGGSFISAITQGYTGTGTWQQISLNTVLAATATKCTALIYVGSVIETFYIDKMIFSSGNNTPFTGDTPSTTTDTYAWTGTAEASTSTHSWTTVSNDPFPQNAAGGNQLITSNVPYRIQLSAQSRTMMIKVEEKTVNTLGYLGHALTYRPMSHFVFDSNYIIQ